MFSSSDGFCPIVGCKYFNFAPNDVRFFFVSKTHRELVNKWLESIRNYMPDFPDDISHNRICQLHFDPTDLKLSRGQLQLRFGAIPKHFPGVEPKQDLVPEKPASLQKVTIIREPIESIKQALAPSTPQDPMTISSKPTQNAAIFASSKCNFAVCNVQMEAMQKRVHALEERIKDNQYEIKTLHKRNQYLKTFEPKNVKKTEECSVCKLKLTTDELYLHLCKQLDDEKPDTIRCEYCLKSYSATMKLLNHLRVSHNHKQEKKFYRCNQCTGIFGMAKLMDIHAQTHPKQKPEIITQNYNDKCTQKLHPKPEDPLLKPFQCGHCNCGERFGTPNLLGDHMRKSHVSLPPDQIIVNLELEKRNEQMNFECYLCRESFETFKAMQSHIEKHFKSPIGKLNAKCYVCMTKMNVIQLNDHLCEHIVRTRGSIDCEYCPEKLMSIVKLFRHIDDKHAHEKTLYRCIENCRNTFPIKSLLEYHRFVHTQEIYKCNKCSGRRSFETLEALNQHIKRHEIAKCFLCDECGKAFRTTNALKKHKVLHGPKLISCDKCPRKFGTTTNLRKHQNFHSNQIWSCHLCNVKCSSSYRLLIHIKRHTNPKEKRFECTQCTFKATEQGRVNQHMSTVHTTIRQFHCDFENCSRSYKHKGDLNKHLRTHLGDAMYACSHCPKRFRLQLDLQKHASEHYVEERNVNTET